MGRKTVIDDNPSLTTREYFGKNPIRLFLDKNGTIKTSYEILNNAAETIQFVINKTKKHQAPISFDSTIDEVCKYCFENNIQSVIIEGGRQTLQSFIDQNIWDEARVFEAEVELKSGIEAPKLTHALKVKTQYILNDQLTEYQNTSNE